MKRCLLATNKSTDNDSCLEKHFEINNSNNFIPSHAVLNKYWPYKITAKGDG